MSVDQLQRDVNYLDKEIANLCLLNKRHFFGAKKPTKKELQKPLELSQVQK